MDRLAEIPLTNLKISTEKLGQSAFGIVYRGNFFAGTDVAIKEILMKRKAEEIKTQIYAKILRHNRVRHSNIV